MNDPGPQSLIAFAAGRRLAEGDPASVAVEAARALAADPATPVLVFDARTGAVVDLDLRGDAAAIRARYAPPPTPRGRPKLGVTAREVTLLPRHWDWLAAQPGGASVALRRLVEAASRTHDPAAEARARTDAAYRFIQALAGDRPGFEEAARALFARDLDRFEREMAGWPADVRRQALRFVRG